MTYFAEKIQSAIKGTVVGATVNTFCWQQCLDTKKMVEDHHVRAELRRKAEKALSQHGLRK